MVGFGGDSLGKGWETLAEFPRLGFAEILQKNWIKTLGTNFGNRIILPDSSPFWGSNSKWNPLFLQWEVMGKVFIQAYGCQMNEYDTDKMFELLGTQNYTPVSSMDEADLVLQHCSVRIKPSRKCKQVGRCVAWKQNPNVKIGVGGVLPNRRE